MSAENCDFGDMHASDMADYRITLRELLAVAAQSDLAERSLEAFHLYLAAYEMASSQLQGGFLVDGDPALDGLHRAWEIACTLGDRNLASHVLELLDPYLTLEEMADYAEMLEEIAMDGLARLGDGGKSLRDVAEMITRDFMQSLTVTSDDKVTAVAEKAAPEPAGKQDEMQSEDHEPLGPGSCRLQDLVGFEDEIEQLRACGILSDDEQDIDFLQQMSLQHGIVMPASQPTTVFRGVVRDDADRLMLAVAAEMEQPTVRMRVDDNALAGAVLCVVASNGFDPRTSMSTSGFALPKVLVLEGIDSWMTSVQANSMAGQDDPDMQSGLTKGAYRALALIRAAIADPGVTVFASVTSDAEPQIWLDEMLGQARVFEVGEPGESERDSIWNHLMGKHPSLSPLDRFELVQLSAHMCRCDIFAAAHEAVEQAFTESVRNHAYNPVTRSNILDKIAAYQPLDSAEYKSIEDMLVEDLLEDIERYESDGQ